MFHPRKLKTSEVKLFREQLLVQQGGVCALCGEAIEAGKAVLDHDHKTGYVRAVLHRGCNALEGQITNALPRNLITPTRLAEIFANWERYHNQHTSVLHPKHKEKPVKKK